MAAIIDLVKWEARPEEQLYAWKFPHNNLSTYTQLIVNESQEAILFSKGEKVGKFGPGKHTLNTENLPLLRSMFGIPFGGKNPFTAEVWFVNKLMPLNIEWKTDNMSYDDPEYKVYVPLFAEGRYGVKIIDAERFIIKLVGTGTYFTAKHLTDNFYGATVSKTKSVLLQFILNNNIGFKKISAYLDPLSDNLKQSLSVFWEDYGFQLISFYITTIDVDTSTPEGKKIKNIMASQSEQVIGGYTWQQAQAFKLGDKAIDTMGNNTGSGGQGGILGAVLATNIMGSHMGGAMMQPATHANPMPQQTGLPDNVTGLNSTKTVYCSNCAKKFTNNMKFCPHCGDPYTGCPKCGADNDVNAKKCVSCGTSLSASTVACSNCNSPLSEGSAFCGKCGKPVESKEGGCKRCGYKLGNAPFCPQCGLKN